MSKSKLTSPTALAKALAGAKWEKVFETADKMISEGKSPLRALADALELHKCPNTLTSKTLN